MKRLVLCCMVLLCILACGTGQAETLSFVVPEYPPHTYADPASDSGVSGLAVEIVAEALGRMGYSYEFKVFPWARGLYLVEQGAIDGVFNLYRTPHREQVFDYCSSVLFDERIYLFTTSSSKLEWNGDWAAFKGKKIGVALGFSYGSAVDSARAAKRITCIDYYSMQEAMKALFAGKVDAILSDYVVAHVLAESAGRSGDLRALLPIVESVPSYVAFSKVRKLTAVRDNLDVVLRAMHAEGTIIRMMNEFYKRYAAGQ